MKKFAVIGDPIDHSLSPAIHSKLAGITSLELDYRTVNVPAGGLGHWLDTFKAEGYSGFNATMPHKLDLLEWVDELSLEAKAYGAVNTVVYEEGRLKGCNTDGRGFMAALGERLDSLEGLNVLVLGAGGSAKAIVLELAKADLKNLYVLNRKAEKSIILATEAGAGLIGGGLELGFPEGLTFDAVINTIPSSADVDYSPYTRLLKSDTAAMDICYEPSVTPFMSWANQGGARAFNGLDMLIYQAIFAFEIFHKLRLEAKDVKDLVKKALVRL